MQRCILCGRKISNSKYNFGLNCLKRMCNTVGVDDVKNSNGEVALNKRVLELANKKSLLKSQRQLLTDRYLTLQLLNEVPLHGYEKYRNLVRKDIETINRSTRKVPSSDVITLKQASEVNKIYKTYKSTFQKIIDGDYDIIQNIAFEVVRFAFSKYYNNKQYLSDMTQELQHYILKLGVIGLLALGNKYASRFLDHSLQEHPDDIIITNGDIITDITTNPYFKDKINKIIKEHENASSFDIEDSFSFEDGDLFYALHIVKLVAKGTKVHNKWNLSIILSDKYDFTDFKEITEYVTNENFAKGFIGSTANNLAMLGTSCKVVNEYNITIKFEIENWEE